MIESKKVLAVIPARGGSKSIPNKNLCRINGKPLIAYSIIQAVKSKYVDKVMVTTDSPAIARASKKYGAKIPYLRPANLSTDRTPMLPVIKDVLKHYEDSDDFYEYVIILQPTSPMRKPSDIDAGIEKIHKTGADSVVSVSEVEHQHQLATELKGDRVDFEKVLKKNLTRKQSAEKIYYINGTLFIARVESMKKFNRYVFEGDCRAVVIDKSRAFQIDDRIDLKIIRKIMSGK